MNIPSPQVTGAIFGGTHHAAILQAARAILLKVNHAPATKRVFVRPLLSQPDNGGQQYSDVTGTHSLRGAA